MFVLQKKVLKYQTRSLVCSSIDTIQTDKVNTTKSLVTTENKSRLNATSSARGMKSFVSVTPAFIRHLILLDANKKKKSPKNSKISGKEVVVLVSVFRNAGKHRAISFDELICLDA